MPAFSRVLGLLAEPVTGYIETQEAAAELRREVLQQTLNDFGVAASVGGYMTGPVITMYELTVAPGVKVSQVAGLATDIARALAVPGVRIVPPRFGKDTIGIEVPNLDKEIVRIRELMDRPVLIDGRNIYDPATMEELGFYYRGVGRGYEGQEA